MNHRKWQLLSGALVLAVVAAWLIAKKQPDQQDDIAPAQDQLPHRAAKKETQPLRKPSQPSDRTNTKQALPSSPQQSISQGETDQILEDLHKAAITYDAAELAKITPYLLHSHPDIRKAAIDAMITLGDAAAAPLLRTAAQNAPTPHEAVALLNAADYVELPSAKIQIKKKDPQRRRK
ncbi:MAG: hypothetical protein KJO21_07410 [Verrucomicrobiae bacterium]|nr:hypothetical protein [Verrucomicrobiae bacterium]NNJ43300.1 hypothetical protein [Akkermansiaceae bacterium]